MEEKKPIGSIISITVIVFVLAFGAYYFLKQVPAPVDEATTLTPTEIQADSTISTLSNQGTSTDLTEIQKDLNATNLSGLDEGLSNVAI